MALDFEYNRLVVSNINDSRTFTRSHQDARSASREATKKWFRVFVGTMLGPHYAEYANFRIVWLTAEKSTNEFILAVRNAHLFVNLLFCYLFCIRFLSGHLLTHDDPSKPLISK
ncbi:hypothetical protein D3C75_1130870 [compost metagenome]